MRLSKSLLAVAAASTLAAATAFAEDSRPGDLLSEEPALLNEDWGYGEQESLAEADVIYIYPMEVTEYYLIVPDDLQPNG
jgi:hypothetical protein